jgi:carboxypeptidase C (cathepsin A)
MEHFISTGMELANPHSCPFPEYRARGKKWMAIRCFLVAITVLICGLNAARAEDETTQPATQAAHRGAKKEATTKESSDEPVVADHEIKLDSGPLKYKTTAGFIQLKDNTDKLRAKVFYMAYERGGDEGERADRPVTFVFNGGPGAASVWLHLGTAGPMRVALPENGFPPAPPYRLEENPYTWLDFTDLVFIDPVGTGYSRAEPDHVKEFYNVDGDISSVAEVIRLYLTKYNRWASPKFVAGESYGTTRAAALSGHLHERYGIDLNGVILISTVLNFQTLEFRAGNDTPYPLWLPSYTAIAWYHKKLAPELQKDLVSTVAEAKKWAINEYMPALLKGSSLTDAERTHEEQQLARYTGLPLEYVKKSKLKVSPGRFEKALLASDEKIIGRMDGRMTGHDADPLNDTPEFDPALSGMVGVFNSNFNDYVRRDLKFENDLMYEFLSPNVGPWDFGRDGGYLNVATTLRTAISEVPSMKVLICSGYFDLATPFGATDYTVNQMPLGDLRGNIVHKYYEGGHMLYLNHPALVKLHGDLSEFYKSSVPATQP